jgi:hypothetical protein
MRRPATMCVGNLQAQICVLPANREREAFRGAICYPVEFRSRRAQSLIFVPKKVLVEMALPQKYSSFLFTPGFSQVTTLRPFEWKPFKRFRLNFEFRDTWLKPGVNERDCVYSRLLLRQVVERQQTTPI